jgi:hypothetical protein
MTEVQKYTEALDLMWREVAGTPHKVVYKDKGAECELKPGSVLTISGSNGVTELIEVWPEGKFSRELKEKIGIIDRKVYGKFDVSAVGLSNGGVISIVPEEMR